MKTYRNPRELWIEHNPYTANVSAQEAAAQYCADHNLPPPQPTPYVEVDKARARDIAHYYDMAPSEPNDPNVRAAYAALIEETALQAQYMTVKIDWVGDGEYPYKNSKQMMDDVLNNNRLAVYTGGDDHPIMTRDQNNLFRAVHDFFGHCQHGFAFGERGEENAWIEHSKMFSPLARVALTTETRGQNSYVNSGPFSHMPVTERPYAQQKTFIMPWQFMTHPVLDQAYRDYPEFYPHENMVGGDVSSNPSEEPGETQSITIILGEEESHIAGHAHSDVPFDWDRRGSSMSFHVSDFDAISEGLIAAGQGLDADTDGRMHEGVARKLIKRIRNACSRTLQEERALPPSDYSYLDKKPGQPRPLRGSWEYGYRSNPPHGEKCFACNKQLRTKSRYPVQTRDGQKSFVGPDCYAHVLASGQDGYRPPLGGPKLYVIPGAR